MPVELESPQEEGGMGELEGIAEGVRCVWGLGGWGICRVGTQWGGGDLGKGCLWREVRRDDSHVRNHL